MDRIDSCMTFEYYRTGIHAVRVTQVGTQVSQVRRYRRYHRCTGESNVSTKSVPSRRVSTKIGSSCFTRYTFLGVVKRLRKKGIAAVVLEFIRAAALVSGL